MELVIKIPHPPCGGELVKNFTDPSALSDSLKTASFSGLMSSASGAPLTASVFGPPSTWSRASSIAFIDASVSDYQTLESGITPNTEVHLLNSSQDAITQMTTYCWGEKASLAFTSSPTGNQAN